MDVYDIITSKLLRNWRQEQRLGVSPGQAEKCRAT